MELLYPKLSYDLRGADMEVRKNFGPGHKEIIYCNALVEELDFRKISFERERAIKIYSPKTAKVIGFYRPDFLIEDKIILEVKAVDLIPKNFIDQVYSYLKNSEFELGYFINFKSPKLYVKRVIYTNDRKPFLKISFS